MLTLTQFILQVRMEKSTAIQFYSLILKTIKKRWK